MSPLRPALSLLGLVAVGCSAPVADEEEIADASEGSTEGILLVEELLPIHGTPQTNVSAKFMRLAAGIEPELAGRIVGSRFDLPRDIPGCALTQYGGPEEVAVLGRGAYIALLDAGDDVRLTAGGHTIPLDRRAFPDIGGSVFGQFYTSRDVQTTLPAPAHYVLDSSGSAEMDRLRVEGDAPAPLDDVVIAGHSLGDDLSLRAGVDASITWRAGSETDLVYVDVTTVDGGGLRCLFADRGEGTLPGAQLRSAVLGPLPTAVAVAAHRIRRVPMSATINGFFDGEIRFDWGIVGHATIAR